MTDNSDKAIELIVRKLEDCRAKATKVENSIGHLESQISIKTSELEDLCHSIRLYESLLDEYKSLVSLQQGEAHVDFEDDSGDEQEIEHSTGTHKERVQNATAGTWRTVDELQELTGLTKRQVYGVLTGETTRDDFERQEIGGLKKRFRLKNNQ